MITVNWCELPLDLLTRIVENHLLSPDDVAVFSSVCHSWNRAARACDKSQLQQNRLRQMPWLMLTDGNNEELYSDTGSVVKHMYENNVMGVFPDYYYSDEETMTSDDEDEDEEDEDDNNELSVDSCYSNNVVVNGGKREMINLSNERNKWYSVSLPETYGKSCWGSRYGWIVILGLDRRMHMFNPLTKSRLLLPSQTTFPYPWKNARDKTVRALFLSKVVLLHVPPAADDPPCSCPWLVVAFHRSYSLVAIARPGDASWKHIKWHDGLTVFMDVVYSDKLKSLVFVDSIGDLYTHNFTCTEPAFKEYLKGPESTADEDLYLIQRGDDDDDYVLVARYFDAGSLEKKTVKFEVFEYSVVRGSWEEVSDMGDMGVFVGGGETVWVKASDRGGCQRNCIYFCEENTWGIRCNPGNVVGADSGVFNLTTKTIQPILDHHPNPNSKSSYSPPFWFSPSI